MASGQSFIIIGCGVKKHRKDDIKKHVQERGFTIEKCQTNGYKIPKSRSH